MPFLLCTVPSLFRPVTPLNSLFLLRCTKTTPPRQPQSKKLPGRFIWCMAHNYTYPRTRIFSISFIATYLALSAAFLFFDTYPTAFSVGAATARLAVAVGLPDTIIPLRIEKNFFRAKDFARVEKKERSLKKSADCLLFYIPIFSLFSVSGVMYLSWRRRKSTKILRGTVVRKV